MKKIAFIGTHGVGKTTLAHELVALLKIKGIDADFLGEIARSCPFPINENASKKAQLWIIFNQIVQELEKEEKSEILVCDRSVLDNYCYYIYLFGESKILEPLVLNHVKTYKYLFKIPIRNGFLNKDKARSVNPEFQRKIDEIMDNLLKKFNIKYIDCKNIIENSEIIEEVIKKVGVEENYAKRIKRSVID